MELRARTFSENRGSGNESTDALLSAIKWIALQIGKVLFSPSKEQICALKDAVETYRIRHNASTSGDNTFQLLESLYAELIQSTKQV